MEKLHPGKDGSGRPLQAQLPIASRVAVWNCNAIDGDRTARNASTTGRIVQGTRRN
jgi:hypothetical protein